MIWFEWHLICQFDKHQKKYIFFNRNKIRSNSQNTNKSHYHHPNLHSCKHNKVYIGTEQNSNEFANPHFQESLLTIRSENDRNRRTYLYFPYNLLIGLASRSENPRKANGLLAFTRFQMRARHANRGGRFSTQTPRNPPQLTISY